ncbi:pseudoazurin [Devosia submarina]|uniref:pseudoazurin n=1 Tax=Devosia submarina TaxID=1173082 RepID=UPI000D3BD03F|nr:pseudoazurin [Devosia submarina]
MRVTAYLIAGGLAALMSVPALAADHQVQMLNKDSEGRAMQFEPAFLKVAPGDTVTFIATNKGHNSESILTLMPEGAEPWKGKINEEITVIFETEGFYAYKCQPHLGLGMVGLIQVGDAPAEPDPAEVEKLPQRAEDRLLELIALAAEGGDAPVAPQ